MTAIRRRLLGTCCVKHYDETLKKWYVEIDGHPIRAEWLERDAFHAAPTAGQIGHAYYESTPARGRIVVSFEPHSS